MLKRRTTFIKPALTPENKLQRMEHDLSFIDDTTNAFEPMRNTVHVDEKWFYADRDKRRRVQHEGWWSIVGREGCVLAARHVGVDLRLRGLVV
ncbi:hypothetical protein F441_01135 [Phytophthora nicotianae CJ01A1]|uniref:Uncharacterized protein n=1 Tax=Phytophthora nicotianae CJ01A1 TaxID=1317063 RepID=W2XUK9_PHYNI|nr:hypothetical protein F441_01135 [Phytophthora nicotianae CJ01A1]